jgi:flagella basal body P-ring formation protein FlgA
MLTMLKKVLIQFLILNMLFLFVITLNIKISFSRSLPQKFYTFKDVRNIFLKNLKKELKWLKGELVLKRFNIEPENFKISKKAIPRIEFLSIPRIGTNMALIKFYLKGERIRVLRAWGYIDARIPVIILKKNLQEGEVIKKEDIVEDKMLLSQLPQDVITSSREVIGKELKISLKAGTILRMTYIEPPTLIKRHQQVYIVAVGKNFIVRARGIALQDGKKGEYIRVRNISSKKIVWGKVISSKEVEVSF